jgi:hypothetical protein
MKLDIDVANANTRAREVELKEKELELIASSRAKEVELKEKEVELKRQAEDHIFMTANLTAMNVVKRAWFEKRRKEILDRTS